MVVVLKLCFCLHVLLVVQECQSDCNLDDIPWRTHPFAYDSELIEEQVASSVAKSEPRPMNGQWQLTWDDAVDGQLDHENKRCTIQFQEIDDSLNGHFIGPVAGSDREAIFTGTVEGQGDTHVLLFQQREAGYVCSYQAIDRGGAITGVWHDTNNRSGDFRLLKFQ